MRRITEHKNPPHVVQVSAKLTERADFSTFNSSPQTSGSMAMPATLDKAPDAIALLKADHRTVEDLFEKYKKASAQREKAELAKSICSELIIHTKIEEEIFYPACRGKLKERDLLDEAQVESRTAHKDV